MKVRIGKVISPVHLVHAVGWSSIADADPEGFEVWRYEFAPTGEYVSHKFERKAAYLHELEVWAAAAGLELHCISDERPGEKRVFPIWLPLCESEKDPTSWADFSKYLEKLT